MTLIFSGHDYKYELESVLKLFIPASRFSFVYSGEEFKLSGDFCYLRRREGKYTVLLYAYCSYAGKKALRLTRISKDKLPTDGGEMLLSKLLFKALSSLTGISPEWGVITGVRPVKRVNEMLAVGATRDEVKKRLSDEFFVSDQKAEIAVMTAENQAHALLDMPKRAFSLYVSIPFCPTRCAYCSFVSQSVEASLPLLDAYLENLLKEIEYTARMTKRLNLTLDTVYIGGGTPTVLSPDALYRLMDKIHSSFDTKNVREFTVEAGRADTVTAEKLKVIKQMGADRVSVNPQTLSDEVLKAIGRKHTVEEFYSAFDLARKAGFSVINTDIIAGLPKDDLNSFKRTVDGLVALSPENITVHTLSVKRASNLNLSGEREVFKNPAGEMVKYANEKLISGGYAPYYLYRQKNMVENLENIGWQKGNTPSLYNIYIMEEVQSIIALGAGASTKLVDQEGGRLERIFNYKHALEYNKHFDLMLRKKDEIERFYNA